MRYIFKVLYNFHFSSFCLRFSFVLRVGMFKNMLFFSLLSSAFLISFVVQHMRGNISEENATLRYASIERSVYYLFCKIDITIFQFVEFVRARHSVRRNFASFFNPFVCLRTDRRACSRHTHTHIN